MSEEYGMGLKGRRLYAFAGARGRMESGILKIGCARWLDESASTARK